LREARRALFEAAAAAALLLCCASYLLLSLPAWDQQVKMLVLLQVLLWLYAAAL
jgi:hypothetical protein